MRLVGNTAQKSLAGKFQSSSPGYVIQRIDRYVREHKVKSRSSFLADAALEKWVRA